MSEVPAEGGQTDEVAVLLTGAGGWAGLDQELAAHLAANGVPTVGLNSLKYFWTERTPEEAAHIVRDYITWACARQDPKEASARRAIG